jgi:inosine-uridine nucleoside N-ribohydrolase
MSKSNGPILLTVAAIFFLTPRIGRADPDLVIYDNDWNVPGSYYEENALMPLLTSPLVKVIGLTSVTGDCWRDEGTASVLRFLEVIGRPDIPVYNGAVFPLVNTKERMYRWEETYGFIYWKGAFNDPAKFPGSHPDDPYKITPPPDRMPLIHAAEGTAADYLIRAVHEHPHQVTLFAGGPLTNIALAVALDPEFSGLAKRLVVFGGALGELTDGDNDGFHSDFDFIFDPEAAHIVLSAHWEKVISVADVSNDLILDKALMARIQAHPSPAARCLALNSTIGLPLWGEVATSILADPTLITKTIDVTMDVDTDHGMEYGRTVTGPIKSVPRLGTSVVTIIQSIDRKRFVDQLVSAIQTDVSSRGP